MYDDLQVQLTHARNRRLTALVVVAVGEARILPLQRIQRVDQPVLVGVGPRLDRKRDDRIGKLQPLQHDRILRVAQRVAGQRVLQAHKGHDVPGGGFVHRDALFRVKLPDPGNVLFLVLRAVEHARARLQHAAVHPREMQVAMFVRDDLEHQGRERLVRVRMAVDGLFGLQVLVTGDGRDVQRIRQISDDCTEQRPDAHMLQRRAAQKRLDLPLQRALADRPVNVLLGEFLFVEVLLHRFVIVFDDLLQKHRPHEFDVVGIFGRNVFLAKIGSHIGRVVVIRLASDQVDLPGETVAGAHRDLQDHGTGLEARLDILDHHFEVGAHAVHLVDETEAWHMVPLGLSPDRLGLGFDAADGTEHGHRTVQHP